MTSDFNTCYESQYYSSANNVHDKIYHPSNGFSNLQSISMNTSSPYYGNIIPDYMHPRSNNIHTSNQYNETYMFQRPC